MRKASYYSMKKISKKTLKVSKNEIDKYQSKNTINQVHDITIRKVLMEKREAVLLINSALNLNDSKHKLKVDQIELYNNRFVTKSFFNKETDVIYKMKDKDVFFLLEHQSTIDYNMPRRIVEYKIEIIMQSIKDSKKNSKNYRTPLVKAIVIYTGDKKWDVAKTIEETQVELFDNEIDYFGSYIPIDVNNYSEEDKIREKGALFKIIMLDRANSKESLERIYEKISEQKLTKQEQEIIRDYTTNVTSDIFSNEEIEKIIKKYKEKEGGNMLVETLKREMQRDREEAKRLGREEGIREGKKVGIKEGKRVGKKEGEIIGLKSVAKEMLKGEVDVQMIKQWTKLTEKEINELRREI